MPRQTRTAYREKKIKGEVATSRTLRYVGLMEEQKAFG